jgi:hypothetical protein
MALLELTVLPRFERQFQSPQSQETIALQRLIALCSLFDERPFWDGLIDTGAMLTVIPQRIWQRHEARIEWLEPTDSSLSLEECWTHVSGLSGGGIPSRLGKAPLTFLDPVHKRRLPLGTVVAKFALDGGALPRALLGLCGGVFEGRRLVVEIDRERAWIEEQAAAD